MNPQKKIDEIMEEYKNDRETFSDFCRVTVFLLEKLLKNHSIQYQMVSSRVKDITSTINKFNDNSKVSNIETIRQLDDLAGCRVIFYLDGDLQRFVHFIYQEFEVIKNNLRHSNDDYNAQHLVIKFKEDRLKLTEYKQFDGLICELQLTTV
jgi:ppGpp synthetase/RelA/SpoT-type nucleotidyltranferase